MTSNVDLITSGDHPDPFAFLGLHEAGDGSVTGVVVRAFLPGADQAWVVEADGTQLHSMQKIRDEGFFEITFPNRTRFAYRLKAVNRFGDSWEFHDPYSFLPLLTDYDLHLMAEGTHYRNYEKLGAHVRVVDGVRGVHFAVWAPNAKRVS